MAPHVLNLTLSPMRMRIPLDSHAADLWNRISFFEETNNHDQYEEAWEELINYLQVEIEEQFWHEFLVDDARVYHG